MGLDAGQGCLVLPSAVWKRRGNECYRISNFDFFSAPAAHWRESGQFDLAPQPVPL